MGTRGPVPKRTAERRRENKPTIALTQAVAGSVSSQPAGDPEWHPLAANWYRSLADSGQSRFYEPSDWALAASIAEAMSRDLKPRWVKMGEDWIETTMPVPGASVASWLRAMTVLLATEGDRRRLSLELKRAEAQPADRPAVADLHEFRRRFAS